MTGWTTDELTRIGDAEELEIAARRVVPFHNMEDKEQREKR